MPAGARLDDSGTAALRGVEAGGAAALDVPPAARGGVPRRTLTGVAVPLAVVGLVILAVRIGPPGGLSLLQQVGCGLAVAAAVTAAVTARSAARTPVWQVAAGAIVGSGALACCRLVDRLGHGARQDVMTVCTVGALLVMAISVHLVLALPDGRLNRPRLAPPGAAIRVRPNQPSTPRRVSVITGYAAAVAAGLLLGLTNRSLGVPVGVLAWAAAIALTLPAVRLSYLASAGRDRERLQWLAAGAVLALALALVATTLHVLVGWPGPLAAAAAACTVLVMLGMMAGELRSLGPAGGRVLVQVIAVAGFAAVVSAIYLIVVLGVGSGPADAGDRELLGLSMLAAAIAAVGYLPARDRLLSWATHAVYGAREAPDEALRTFGSRLTRAIPMDELLLQLAESLRKTMALTSAEVYTGSGDVLERAVSVPDAGPRSIVVTPRERPVITSARVSGTAWATVWLPALLDGRERTQLRVAPVSHGGQLLGLIVVERPAGGDSFTDEDERVLTDLARQVGLAFHNAQLDSALQNTLDELRAQAEALRESRARIVASGDAERRRLERNLHDGAQQNLVALAIGLRLARDVLTDEPDAAAQMLDQLADDLKLTISELRDLAHGIYPPLLADSGLAKALEAAASRSPLAVHVTAEGIGRYHADIEAAVYFCCLEALQNAAKHAPGCTVQIRLWEESGGLLFAVSDDGPGFDTAVARSGHGYMNMADRLGAIGGTVRWQSEPGHGATVQGSIPLT
ncbi:MAG TPA: histidine kinase [Streptosporangiaceae bacterium]|nr:histidine kinase [Streptosporangiaceae bacterium]